MKLKTDADNLTIQFEGLEKLWTLKGQLRVPRAAISDVDFLMKEPVMQDLHGYLRLPGTNLPWLFTAGSFRKGRGREFWFLRRRTPGVMTIFVKPDQTSYDKIRLTTTPEIAQQVADWWKTG